MNVELFREAIKYRIYVENISCGEWNNEIENCWEKEIEILTEDIPSTIEFLKNECTADEYSWISEILDDIIKKVPDKNLLQAYKELMYKYPEECLTYYIAEQVETAEEILKVENEHGKKTN